MGDDGPLVSLTVSNGTSAEIELLWVSDGVETSYGRVPPQGTKSQETFAMHEWRCRSSVGGALLASVVVCLHGIHLRVENYSQRVAIGTTGLHVKAHSAVCPKAVTVAAEVIASMLRASPAEVVDRLRAADCSVAIIGRAQLLSDLPEHAQLSARACGSWEWDATTRGVCDASRALVSVGEENLLDDEPPSAGPSSAPAAALGPAAECRCACCGGVAPSPELRLRLRRAADPNPLESILVHEFAHAVMDVGLDEAARARIRAAHASALARGEVSERDYIGSNASEYWAEGAQAWLGATVRCDVNCGLNTRDEIEAREPQIAAELERAFGRAEWGYAQTLAAAAPRRAERWEERRRKQDALRKTWSYRVARALCARVRARRLAPAASADPEILAASVHECTLSGLAAGEEGEAPTSMDATAPGDSTHQPEAEAKKLWRVDQPLCSLCDGVVAAAAAAGLPRL